MTLEEALRYPVGDIARGYITLKDAIAKEDAAYAERIKPHREQLDLFLKAMGLKLKEAGAESIRTDHGTVYASVHENVKIEDWDAFDAFVDEVQEPGMRARSINKTAILEWRNKTEQLPPGLSTSAITNINFRRT